MARLLRANFARLWKTKSFWICALVSFAVPIIWVIHQHFEYAQYPAHPDGTPLLDLCDFPFWDYGAIFIFMIIFTGMFVGTEFSHHTIRNILAIGHSRMMWYFADIIVCMTAAVIMHTMSFLGTMAIGFPMGYGFETPAEDYLPLVFLSYLVILGACAFYVMLMTIIAKKSAGITACFIVTFLCMMGTMNIPQMLYESETVKIWTYVDDEIVVEEVDNPKYVGGAMRDILELYLDIVPDSQMMNIYAAHTYDKLEHKERIPLYSFGLIAVTATAGAVVFRRKDLK